MRLALVLFRGHGPPGLVFAGKHRKLFKVHDRHLERLKNALERDEKNMFYLRHPYLTQEQDKGWEEELRPDSEKTLRRKEACKLFLDSRLIESDFSHLRKSDKWE
ncbi:unnamed protein product [Darwinula stevensoni]|uniref:Ribosomal protein 63, mitochondrial n=1 Tax=Darwinula stevensoni TaxID=69355 RepID=A0A7R8XFD4_9CRUS|nr:unnamed protein product [Darwinula stevensoni]CAG0895408.1 unnamed protein product [Darwinula stevensoni]